MLDSFFRAVRPFIKYCRTNIAGVFSIIPFSLICLFSAEELVTMFNDSKVFGSVLLEHNILSYC